MITPFLYANRISFINRNKTSFIHHEKHFTVRVRTLTHIKDARRHFFSTVRSRFGSEPKTLPGEQPTHQITPFTRLTGPSSIDDLEHEAKMTFEYLFSSFN